MFVAALLMGLMGSLHCVGMCGPIALALPMKDRSNWSIFKNISLYNLGRAASYSLIGLIPGVLGLGVSMAGQQKNLSLAVGIFLILSSFFSFSLENKLFSMAWLTNVTRKVQDKLSALLKNNNSETFFSIGVVNGFLPCGMVYMALAVSLSQESLLDSVLFMTFFGLGTFPLMLAMGFLGLKFITPAFRNTIKKWAPIFIFAFGVFLIYRALHIYIPSDLREWFFLKGDNTCA